MEEEDTVDQRRRDAAHHPGEDTEEDRDREKESGISIPTDHDRTLEVDHVLEATPQDRELGVHQEEELEADGEIAHHLPEAREGEEVRHIVAIRATVTGVGVGVAAGMADGNGVVVVTVACVRYAIRMDMHTIPFSCAGRKKSINTLRPISAPQTLVFRTW